MMSMGDKLIKCEKKETIANRCDLHLIQSILIKGRMLPSGRTHVTPPHNSVKWTAIFTALSLVTDLSYSCAARNLWAFIQVPHITSFRSLD